MKVLFKFFTLILMMSLSAEQIEIKEISKNLKKSKDRPSIDSRYKFFYNSIALNNALLPNPSLLGVKSIGSYAYELDKSVLEEFIDTSSKVEKLYVVEDFDHSIKFTDGKLIIKFSEGQNLEEFAKNNSLELTSDFSAINTGVFKVQDFFQIEKTILNLQAQKNIKEIELNTLNPEIQKR
ncbi:hypothetical protein M9B40_03350 [SAR86 cluster bacterium]|uniref:Outer membrane lipoprotein carrier protein LolA n=1 Tax=SAR86 cluster bacterium TaxID=2030880 RepID=A0A9Q8X214_9GAMM|nr:hypothetical protein M9B40_03350 [SAR86 cluster bacterium]